MLIASTLADRVKAAVNSGFKVCKRPEPVPLAQWADENFWLSPEGSTNEGRWETLPFQRAIMNAIGHPDIEQINIVKSARVGYTQMIRAALGYFLAHKARSQIVYQPTDSDAQNFMKSHAEPMIRDVPVVRDLAPWLGKKHRDSTLDQKRFSNGKKLFVLGGTAARNYREKSVDNVFYDELSKFDDDIECEGSPTFLGDKRFEHSIFPKSVRGSTPGIEPTEDGKGCQITVASRQALCYFRRHVPCPHCHKEIVLRWGGVDCDYGIKWFNDDPKTAAYMCEHCAALIENKHAMAMDEAGIWRCEKTGIYTINGEDYFSADGKQVDAPVSMSFHAWTACNPLTPWSKIVEGWLKTKGDRGTLKAFVNTTLGETWDETEGEKIEPNGLYMRREFYSHPVPIDDCILTAAVDVQDDRLEIEVEAWREGEEQYSISYDRLYGDLSRAEIWEALARHLRQTFETPNGSKLEIRLTLIDSGGHYTDEAYNFSKKYGVLKCIPTKGHSVMGKPIVDFPRKRNKKGVYLTMIGTDTAKEVITNRLLIASPGEGFIHFPLNDQFDENYFKHLTNERKVPKIVKGRRTIVWDAGGRRNEPFDLKVLNLAAIRLLQQNFGINLSGLKPQPVKEKKTTKPKAPKKMMEF